MTLKRPAPTREELNAALDWIKDHKKRSWSHTIILLLLTAVCAPVAGGMIGTAFALDPFIVAGTYFGAICVALFVF